MIPSYLHDLALPNVFAQYTKQVESYLLESTKNEHIVDSEAHHICGFVTPTFGQEEDKAQRYFAIENPSAKPYALLQIDKGLIQHRNTKKCDCAIANDTNICFIEFKANAESGCHKTISKIYDKAIEQLQTTINIFNQHYSVQNTDVTTLRNVEAYICFRQGYPKFTSMQMNYKAKFTQQNHGIPLSFATTKIL